MNTKKGSSPLKKQYEKPMINVRSPFKTKTGTTATTTGITTTTTTTGGGGITTTTTTTECCDCG